MACVQAAVATERASRYLQQLCKHWSHRFDVSFDATQGTIRFDGAVCRLAAAPEQLSLVLESDDRDLLARMCHVVAEHLKRFAFRETIEVAWAEPPPARS